MNRLEDNEEAYRLALRARAFYKIAGRRQNLPTQSLYKRQARKYAREAIRTLRGLHREAGE